MKFSGPRKKDPAVERQEAAELAAAYPHVYQEFERRTFELINAGRDHYGSRDVLGRIRWDTAIGRATRGTLKVNNNWARPFSIHFGVRNPAHAGFYRLRNAETEE